MDPPPLPPLPITPTITITASAAAAPVPTSNHLTYPESVESSPRSRNADNNYDVGGSSNNNNNHDLPQVPGAKLRLMCSYGGHIIPRPHDKSLCYIGGETRLVVADRHSSFSSLCSRLSRSLVHGRPFVLKYQLPNEDLDSLVSITADEDLENMIEEYDRLMETSSSSSSCLQTSSSRIRLFLFFDKPETAASMGSFLDDAKSETWFVDALNGSGLLPRGLSDSTMDCLLNLDNENDLEAQQRADDHHDHTKQVKNVNMHDLQYSLPDSHMVENSSFFGSSSSSSSSSSPSMSNLPPIRVRVEDQRNSLMEEQFAQMSFAQPPVSVTAVANALPSMPVALPTEITSRVVSDDERSEHGVPVVRLRKPPLPSQSFQHKACTATYYNLPSPDSVAR